MTLFIESQLCTLPSDRQSRDRDFANLQRIISVEYGVIDLESNKLLYA